MYNTMVEGHRGFCAEYPENTMISFEAALELGVDAIEFDVWLTSDKMPMLMHDGNAYRTCGIDKHLRNMTFEEAKGLDAGYAKKFGDKYTGKGVTVPTLEELLILCREKRPDIILGVEIKEYTEETVDLTVSLLKQYGFFDTCFFYCFSEKVLDYIKSTYGGRTMGYPDFQMKERGAGFAAYEELGLSMAIVKSELMPFYVAKGFPMHLYCADTEADVRLCLEYAPKLITANDPRPLLKILGRL